MCPSSPHASFVDAAGARAREAGREAGVSESEMRTECGEVCVAGDEVQLWGVGGPGGDAGKRED